MAHGHRRRVEGVCADLPGGHRIPNTAELLSKETCFGRVFKTSQARVVFNPAAASGLSGIENVGNDFAGLACGRSDILNSCWVAPHNHETPHSVGTRGRGKRRLTMGSRKGCREEHQNWPPGAHPLNEP